MRKVVTIRKNQLAPSLCLTVALALLAGGCSREQQDWRSAEAADTIESYARFVQRHPESELATQARARVAQLEEERDWEAAGSAATPDAYREFLGQYPNGRWAQEARIRIESFSLEAQPRQSPSAGTSAQARPPARTLRGPPQPGEASASVAPQAPRPNTPTASADTRTARPATMTGSRNTTSESGTRTAETGTRTADTDTRPSVTDTTSPATNTTPAPAAAAPSAYGIQLGAFSNAASAESAWRALAARFSQELQGLTARVVPADVASGRVYRLQAGVDNESHARVVCDALKRQSQSCVPVLPH